MILNLDDLPSPPIGKTGWPWTEQTQPTYTSVLEQCKWLRISIVTPSYNQGQFIEETIRSVLLQGYPNLEYIIIDGGSQDSSVEIIKKYEQYITYWVSEPDRGQSHALNKGFAKATGEIMAWLCADDFYLPNAFITIANHFQRFPSCKLVYGNRYIADSNSRIIRRDKFDFVEPKAIYNWCYICTPATFWHRCLWLETGGQIDEENYFTMDWDLMIRMIRLHPPIKLDYFITVIRRHSRTKTYIGMTDQRKKRDLEIIKVSRRYSGYFCFNSIAYLFYQIACCHLYFQGMPKILYSIIFRVLHLPLQFIRALYGNPKSSLLND